MNQADAATARISRSITAVPSVQASTLATSVTVAGTTSACAFACGRPWRGRRHLELDERAPDLDPPAHLGAQSRHPARPRSGNLDNRLVGRDGNQRLVGHHVVPLGDMPRHDSGQASAEIRKQEDIRGGHGSPTAHAPASTSRAATRIRSVDGK